MTADFADQFWAKTNKTETCWLWTGHTNGKGYGRIVVDGRKVAAHRIAYELAVGPIPEGLVVDHVRARGCTSRLCCNPAHLEPVTNRENLLRGDTLPAENAAKTHCPSGHAYDEANTYTIAGHRRCRACGRAAFHRYKARKRAKEGASRG